MQSKLNKAVVFTAACLLACQSYTLANDKNDTVPNNPNPPAGQNAVLGTTNDAAARARMLGEKGECPALLSRGAMSEKEFDNHFVMDVAEANMAEIAIAKVAMQRSDDPRIKQFAEMLVKDHEQAGNELKKIASEKGYTVPTALNEVGAAKVSMAEKNSGPDFDRHFVFGAVGDHATTILCFRAGEQLVSDPQLKEFARQTLPTLQHHFHEAESLANGSDAIQAGAHLEGNNNATPKPVEQNK